MLRRVFFATSSCASSTSAAQSFTRMRLEALAAHGESVYAPTHARQGLADSVATVLAQPETQAQWTVLGRVVSKRQVSAALCFVTVRDVAHASGGEMQIKLRGDAHLLRIAALVRRGDVLRARGSVDASRAAMFAETAAIEAVMLRPWQLAYEDRHVLHSQRYLDLLTTPGARERFVRRAHALRTIRAHLDEVVGAIEVETPTLAPLAGGAAAVPFETRSHALDQKLFLRIAPELYLKQVVIGGIPRVYEIGKQFRNEGVDRSHNPEFTTLELYVVDGTLEQLMQLTRDLITRLLTQVFGCAELRVGDIDFAAPYRRISFVDELSRALGVADVTALADDELLQHAAARVAGGDASALLPRPPRAKLLDMLFSELVEPGLQQPTFVVDHPVELSPLARALPGRPRVAERFEFYVAGLELANAYGELSDPREQAERFAAQHPDDHEAMPADQHFLEALHYALPPTAGYGLGIDRLFMLLANVHSIRDAILFPMLRQDEKRK